MKKLALFVCLLVVTVAAQAQFEKGKWILNPSITGLEFSHDTGTDKTSFGLEAKGGAFLLDNIALLVHAGAAWNTGGSDLDVYTLGVGDVIISTRLACIWVPMSMWTVGIGDMIWMIPSSLSVWKPVMRSS